MTKPTENQPKIKPIFNPKGWRYVIARWLLGTEYIHVFNAEVEIHDDGTFTVIGMAKK